MAYASNNITQALMSELTAETYRSIVSSHRLISRIEQPYYHSEASVPLELVEFKRRLTALRTQSLALTLARYAGESDPLGQRYDSPQSFACSFTGSLAVAGLGLGECGECATKLAANMLVRGFGNITFLQFKFTNARAGMEQGHQLIIANISQAQMSALRKSKETDFLKFMGSLPADAVVGDAFLNICFTPSAIPQLMRDYITAYGGAATINGVNHFTHLGPKFFKYYADHAGAIQKILASHPEGAPRLYVLRGPWKASLMLSVDDSTSLKPS